MGIEKISANYIFLIDKKNRRFIPKSNITLSLGENGEIVSIEEGVDNQATYYNGAIIPGFVNAHSHIELSHLKGAFEEATGMSGFINQINSLRESVGIDGRLKAIEREIANQQEQGVVGISDISNCTESFKFKKESNIRFRTFVELFGTEEQEAQNVLNNGKGIVAIGKQMGLNINLTPHSCYTMSPKLLELTIKEAIISGYLSYHSQESSEEEDLIRFGTGPLAENYKNRGLSTPPITGRGALEYFINRIDKSLGFNGKEKIDGKINFVHNVAIDEDSIQIAKDRFRSPFFTLCPLSNIFIHRVLPPIRLMLRHELDLCIGTDSLSSNKTLSMIDEIKCINQSFKEIEIGELFYWGCYNGAKVIGEERDLGSIEVGKKPGLVLVQGLDDKFNTTDKTISKRIK